MESYRHEERDMQIIRLRLLHPAQHSNTAGAHKNLLKLSPHEVQVVAAHLRSNVEEIVTLLGDDIKAIQHYVEHECTVIEIDEKDLESHHSPYYQSLTRRSSMHPHAGGRASANGTPEESKDGAAVADGGRGTAAGDEATATSNNTRLNAGAGSSPVSSRSSQSSRIKQPSKTLFYKRGEPANTCILILSGEKMNSI